MRGLILGYIANGSMSPGSLPLDLVFFLSASLSGHEIVNGTGVFTCWFRAGEGGVDPAVPMSYRSGQSLSGFTWNQYCSRIRIRVLTQPTRVFASS